MLKHTFIRALLVCSMPLLAAGCVQRAPFLESQMGHSLSLIKAQQVINPHSSSNADPVTGMDSKAAKSAQDRYQQSFKAPQPPANAFTIGIGSR